MGGHWTVEDAGREIVQNWFDQASLANGFRPLDVTKTIGDDSTIKYMLLGSADGIPDGMHLEDFRRQWSAAADLDFSQALPCAKRILRLRVIDTTAHCYGQFPGWFLGGWAHT